MESRLGKGCTTIIAIFLFLLIAIAVFGYFFLQNFLAPYKAAIKSTEEIEQEFGRIEDFCPREKTIRPQQVEKFISVLTETLPLRNDIARILKNFKLSNLSSSTASINWKRELKVAVKLAFKFAMFYNLRNRSLKDVQLGLGEYYYLYSAIYYGWLGKDPLEYHSLRLGGLKVKSEKYVWYQEKFETENDSLLSDRQRTFRIAHLRKVLMPILNNQLNFFTAQGDSDDFVLALKHEVQKLETDTLRIPFVNGFHAETAKYLPEFRSRLDSLFCPQTDFYELFPVHQN